MTVSAAIMASGVRADKMNINKIICIITILALSFGSVCAITALICALIGTNFSVVKAVVLWVGWYAINVIRRELKRERNEEG